MNGRSQRDTFSAQMSGIMRSAQLVLLNCMTENQPVHARNVAPTELDENSGDHGNQGSPTGGDKEFFLDEFDSADIFTQSPGRIDQEQVCMDAKRDGEAIPSHFERVEMDIGTKDWASDRAKLRTAGGEVGRSPVGLSVSKKRPSFAVSEDEMKQWSLAEFMASSRSASQQAAIELGVQTSWSQHFAAGCVHSMIRCTDQPESIYTEVACQFTTSTDDKVDAKGSGRPRCSHPGCTKQVQSRGLCMAHGGYRVCTYPGCSATSRWQGRCILHGGRRTCTEKNCTRSVRSGGKCVQHGARRAKCLFPDCTSTVQRKGLCAAHGGSLSCTVEGCSKKVLTKGLCGSHGGGLRCKTEGCDKLCQYRGFCIKHAGENGVPVTRKARCKVDGCLKFRINSGYCMRHAKERGIVVGHKCKTEGCEKVAQAGGHCIGHGGGARCTFPGCTRCAVSKGLCSSHGGRVTCKTPGCTKWGLSKGDVKGYCIQHGGGKRCKYAGCNKSVQRKGLCCTHGGWYACQAEGCNKRLPLNGFCASHKDNKASSREDTEEIKHIT